MNKILFACFFYIILAACSPIKIEGNDCVYCHSGRDSILTLFFSGIRGDNYYQRMDYISIKNITRGWHEILYNPDTSFILTPITPINGICNVLGNDLITISPNPFSDSCRIDLELALSSKVVISVFDYKGSLCNKYENTLNSGSYTYTFPVETSGVYIINASINDLCYTRKIVNLSSNSNLQISLMSMNNDICPHKQCDYPFELGDVMEYIGYAFNGDTVEASMIKVQPQYDDEFIVLQFTAYLPETITNAVTGIGQSYAMCEGEVYHDGFSNVSERGICWSTEPEPSIDGEHVICGEGIGCFRGDLHGLNMNTTYYVRSYAVNSVGVRYGNELIFNTLPLDSVKILSVGNSFSHDALAYVPFILESMGVDVPLQIGILYLSGASLDDQINSFMNYTPSYTFSLYNGSGYWNNYEGQTIQFALDNYDWDLITLQQNSSNAPYWSTYLPSIDSLTHLINNYIDYSVRYGWYMVQSRPAMSYNGINYTDEDIQLNYLSMAENAQRVIDETDCAFVIPVGTAIQNARTLDDIKLLGDYSNNGNNTSGCGYLTYDGIHLQEGLPRQIAAYSFLLSILEQYGCLEEYTILGEDTRVTPEWVVGKNIPGPKGTPVGSNDTNCFIGQQSAIEALHNPFEVTDISGH